MRIRLKALETGIVTHLRQPGLRHGIFHPEFKDADSLFPGFRHIFALTIPQQQIADPRLLPNEAKLEGY